MHTRSSARTLRTFASLGLIAALALPACGGDGTDAGQGPGQPGDPWSKERGYEEEWDRTHAPAASSDGAFGRSEGGGGASMDSAPVADGDVAASEGEGEGRPIDGDVMPPPEQGGLEGGEVDDNELWDEYLAYAGEALDSWAAAEPMIHWLDVTRRHFVRVVGSDGRTVPGADIEIRAGGEVVAEGKTLSDGRFPFFPNAMAPGVDGPFEARARVGELSASIRIDESSLTTELAFDAPAPRERLTLDLAFVIDATGSMGEEIGRIQATVLEIAAALSGSEFEPDLRLGLVEYRDRGDEYVTHTVNFTPNVQDFNAAVGRIRANGGGDGPEALNEALERTLHRLEWRGGRTLSLAFVIADAPPHHYEDAQHTYDQAMLESSRTGLKIFPVASGGSDPVAEFVMRQLAQFSLGRFVFITEGGGSPHGSGGSDYDVDPRDFDVEALDKLIVRLVTEEMAAWTTGAGALE